MSAFLPCLVLSALPPMAVVLRDLAAMKRHDRRVFALTERRRRLMAALRERGTGMEAAEYAPIRAAVDAVGAELASVRPPRYWLMG